MANSILTINMITREALRLWKNSNAFIQNVTRQYDDQFAQTGAKIGATLRIRLPNDYVVRDGPAMSIQDTTEQSTTLTVAYQKGVDVSFNTKERTLSMDDYSERVLAPAINNTAGAVAQTVMAGVEGGVCNFVSNTSGGAIIAPTQRTYLQGGARLDMYSTPRMERKVCNSEWTQAEVVSSLAGLFNPQAKISEQYMSGEMRGQAIGFDWLMDQTVLSHTSGNFTLTTINGADQTGLTITVAALDVGETLATGDIIEIEDTYMVNRITKQSTGKLCQFVVTDDVAAGGTSIPIYPAIVPGVGGAAVQYQTVVQSPPNGSDVLMVTAASEVYRKNIAFAPEAVTIVTADLVMPTKGVEEAAREVYDSVSLRMLTGYIIGTDQLATRLDVLFGYLWVRPEWACVVADAA